MKISELRRAVEQIEMNDVSRQRMIQQLKLGKRAAHRYRRAAKTAAAVAACVLAAGFISIPVRALVSSLVQERMEALPEEEVQETRDQIQEQEVGADSFSRDYTEAEEERWGELRQKYLNGTFPEGELIQVDSEEEAAQYAFCYLTTTSKFYLPSERDLTDEEILQIIDFNEKRDYALREAYEKEHAEEIAAEREKEKEQIAQTVADGGITEQEAIEIATDYLKRIYGVDGNNMEFNHYFSEAGERYEQASYGVNWSIQSEAYYYFYISADSGQLLGAVYSGRNRHGGEKPAAQEASAIAASIKEQARGFLKDTLGIDEDYDKVESCYYTWNQNNVGDGVRVVFMKEDGTAHSLSYSWEGDVWGYDLTTTESYERNIDNILEYAPQEFAREYNVEVTDVQVVRN